MRTVKGNNLWKKYCSFYEKDFSDQMAYNKKQTDYYFTKWKRTDLAKMLVQGTPQKIEDVPITRYDDYDMLSEFGRKIANIAQNNPKRQGEFFKEYYDRISLNIGSSLNRYMVEPYFLCMKTTGTTGQNKWVVHGKSFWNNLVIGAIKSAIVACSDSWGETKARHGDKGLNLNAPVPHLSGWAALASSTIFQLVPPIEVTDKLKDMKETFSLVLRLIDKGEMISFAGAVGSIFYMISKFFIDPEEFYQEYYHSMNFGLKKILLSIKLIQTRLSRTKKRNITDILPLKGIMVGGMESKLYIDFFKKEFNLEPLHVYGSTEAGVLMRGDPDRKTDLVPDLSTNYFEFQTKDGEILGLDEVKKGEIHNLIVTPFGSILFRYDMEDLLRVIDFRDDGMPIFAFEGRKIAVLRLYGYSVTPNIIVQALARAGLKTSDKWAVTKTLKPKERLHLIMEKSWSQTEMEAEKILFNSLIETEKDIPHRGHTLRDYITDYTIKEPSDVIKVEYLRQGAFLKYAMMRAKQGASMLQYKPPKIIPPEKREIYEMLRSL